MTTAARPTFDPARGGQGRGEKDLSSLSRQYSSRDLPSHTKLKYRAPGQGTVDELRDRDFRRELEDRESGAKDSAVGPRRPAAIEDAASLGSAAKKPRTAEEAAKKPRTAEEAAAALDADDPLDDDDSGSESEDDDAEALLAELRRIRGERAAEQARREAETRREDERIRMENILQGNPLLSYAAAGRKSDMRVRRGWDDDVVFKNCARSEPKRRYEFVNDSLRSEFHKKFLEKYVK